jgi:CheY-like chemotaxis protein
MTVTSNGRAAISQFDLRGWDALVVDLGLPDMDGKSIIRHLPRTVRSADGSNFRVVLGNGGRRRLPHRRRSIVCEPFRAPEIH